MQMESMRSRSDDDFFAEKEKLRLPAELRDELKTPLGEVIGEEKLEAILKDIDTVVTVGDECSWTLYKKGIIPDIAVVDFKIQRKDVENLRVKIQEFGQIVINVDNAPGMLTRELWNAVKSAYETEEKVRIEVVGEEDLAALPCVWLAPENTAVIYGLPNIGLVVFRGEKEAKIKVADVLKKMK